MNKKESAELIIKQDGSCKGVECLNCFATDFTIEDCCADRVELAIKYLKDNHEKS